MRNPWNTTEATGSRPSPGTDPTCSHPLEAFGWPGANIRAAERTQDEPGLTERDRDERDPGKARAADSPVG